MGNGWRSSGSTTGMEHGIIESQVNWLRNECERMVWFMAARTHAEETWEAEVQQANDREDKLGDSELLHAEYASQAARISCMDDDRSDKAVMDIGWALVDETYHRD